MFRKLLSFFLIATSIVSCNAIAYGTEIHSLDVNIASTPTPWVNTIQIPQFNRTNKLVGVIIGLSSTLSSQTNATNIYSSVANGYLYTAFEVDLFLNGTSLLNLYYNVNSPSYQLYQYQSAIDPSPIVKTATKSITTSASSVLNKFVGNATTEVDIHASSKLWTYTVNSGNVIASYVTPPTASLFNIGVKYYYNSTGV